MSNTHTKQPLPQQSELIGASGLAGRIGSEITWSSNIVGFLPVFVDDATATTTPLVWFCAIATIFSD